MKHNGQNDVDSGDLAINVTSTIVVLESIITNLEEKKESAILLPDLTRDISQASISRGWIQSLKLGVKNTFASVSRKLCTVEENLLNENDVFFYKNKIL